MSLMIGRLKMRFAGLLIAGLLAVAVVPAASGPDLDLTRRPDPQIKTGNFLGMRFSYKPPEQREPKARVRNMGKATIEWEKPMAVDEASAT